MVIGDNYPTQTRRVMIKMAMQKPLSVVLHNLLKSNFTHSSDNLAKFARKKDYMKNYYRVLKSDGELFIGYMTDNNLLSGAKLTRIACGNFDTFAFAGVKNPEDVTEWFIGEYKKKGMCAYSGDWNHQWIQDSHEESLEDGSVRECKHCGKFEKLESKMVRKIWWSSVQS